MVLHLVMINLWEKTYLLLILLIETLSFLLIETCLCFIVAIIITFPI